MNSMKDIGLTGCLLTGKIWIKRSGEHAINAVFRTTDPDFAAS